MTRRLSIVALSLLLLFCLLAAAAWWLAAREATLQWLVERGVAASGERLAVTEVHGVLRGPIRIGRAVYRKDGAELVANDILLEWSPRALLDRQLAIEHLHVGSAVLSLSPGKDEPPTVPDTLAAPLDIALRDAEIASFEIKRQDFTTRLEAVAFSLTGGEQTWQGELSSLRSQWGNATARFALGATAPFPLQAEIDVTQLGAPSWSGRAVLSGPLAELSADITAKVQGASVAADIALTPFQSVLLKRMQLRARDIDPRAWRDTLPAANLAVELTARGIENKAYAGDAVIRNTLAGKIDEEKLPLREARAQFSAQFSDSAQALKLPAIDLDFGEAGRLHGDGLWRADSGQKPALQLALSTSALNLRGLHGKLRQTHLAGDIALTSGVDKQVVRAMLSEDGYRFGIDASLAGKVLNVRELRAQAGTGELFAQGEIALDGEQRFDVTGKLTRFDPSQFGDYPKAQINSKLAAKGSLAPEPAIAGSISVYDSRIFGQPLSATGKIKTDGKQLSGGDLLVQLGRTRLDLDGTIALSAAHEFKAAGKIERFDPAQFAKYLGKDAANLPPALINGRFDAGGSVSPQWNIATQFTIHDSTIARRKLSAEGRLNAVPNRVSGVDVAISAGRNRLQLEGALGSVHDQLQWQIAAPELGTFGPDFAGSLHAEGSLAGTFKAPALSFRGKGDKLRLFGEYDIAQVSASGHFANGLAGSVQADVQASGIATPKLNLRDARVTLDGTREQHTVTIVARNETIDLNAALHGAWRDDSGWKGTIDRLVNGGAYPVTLRAPAALSFRQKNFALRNAVVEFADGVFAISALEKSGSRFSSAGSLSKFPASYLIALANSRAVADASKPLLTSSLQLGGEWDLAADSEDDGAIGGKLRVWREGGDLALTEPQMALKLSELTLNTTIERNQVNAALSLQSTIATVNAKAATRISQRDGRWGVAGDAPFSLQANAGIPSLEWLEALLAQQRPGIDLGGALAVKVTGDGTVQAPDLDGTVRGTNLHVGLPEYGVDLENGSLQAAFAGEQLLIQQLVMQAGDGSVSATGAVGWHGGAPSVQLAIDVSQFRALASPDRQFVVSGKGNVALAKGELDIDAKLRADRGLIILPKQGAPTLSDDIVIVGAETGKTKKSDALRADVDVSFDLGNNFRLRGRGLDAQLTGALHVRATPGHAPTAEGRITASGNYAAYNQQLSIERGVLIFTGPIDNPALDILAVRKVPEIERDAVEAGIAITGTAIAPRAQLVSTPNVPDAEKLSWLVSGHGLEGGGGAELSVLSAAAEGLLGSSESASLQSQIARATGLDEVAIKSGGGLEQSVLALGKRLSSRVYVNYEQSLSGAANLVKINYALTPRWSVRGTAGTDSAVDLFYSFSFD
ncbi:MAG: translocation/assembly module TamB domain-containing protein [Burkholderiales bacterium]|nr:translocation/assembly module TamB domain-containing protein [Burkholderiales bacterium]